MTETQSTQTPSRATFKGHEKPETFLFFGTERKPWALGVPCRVEKAGSVLTFQALDDGRDLAWCGTAGKFWAVPMPE